MTLDQRPDVHTTPLRSDGSGKGGRRLRSRREASWLEEVGVLSTAKLVLKLRGLLLLPIMIGLLGTEEFGVWVQWLAVVSLVSTLSGLGLKTSAIRLLASITERDEVARWFWSVVVGAVALSLAGAAALGLLAESIATYMLQRPESTGVFVAGMLYMPPRAVVDLQIRLCRGTGRIRTYSLLEVVDAAGQTAAVILALLIYETLFVAVIALMAWQLVLALALLPLTLSIAPLRMPTWPRLATALRFGAPTVPSTAASAVIDKADRFLIGYFLGAGAVGVYGAAYTLGGLILQLLDPIRQTLIPRLGRLWDTEGREPVVERLATVWRLFALLSVPATAGLALIAEDLLLLLGNPEVAAGGAPLVFWLALSQVLYGVTTLANQIFFASRRTGGLPFVYGLGAVTNMVLNVLLIPRHGLTGAVIATAASYLISAVLGYLLAQRYAALRFDLGPLWRASVATCLMALVVWPVGGAGVGRILIVVPLGTVAYAAGLLLVGGISAGEVRRLRMRLAGTR